MMEKDDEEGGHDGKDNGYRISNAQGDNAVLTDEKLLRGFPRKDGGDDPCGERIDVFTKEPLLRKSTRTWAPSTPTNS